MEGDSSFSLAFYRYFQAFLRKKNSVVGVLPCLNTFSCSDGASTALLWHILKQTQPPFRTQTGKAGIPSQKVEGHTPRPGSVLSPAVAQHIVHYAQWQIAEAQHGRSAAKAHNVAIC